MSDDRLVRAELAALTRARLEGLNGNLDSAVDAPPSSTSGGWRHTQGRGMGPVVFVRYRRGVVGESSRTVHAVTLPTGGPVNMVGARCGAVLMPGDIETVALGEGMPCIACVLRCAAAADAAVTEEPPRSAPDCADAVGPAPGWITYHQWTS
jgi:hypothetical protein